MKWATVTINAMPPLVSQTDKTKAGWLLGETIVTDWDVNKAQVV